MYDLCCARADCALHIRRFSARAIGVLVDGDLDGDGGGDHRPDRRCGTSGRTTPGYLPRSRRLEVSGAHWWASGCVEPKRSCSRSSQEHCSADGRFTGSDISRSDAFRLLRCC